MIRLLARLVLVLCALAGAGDTAVARSYDVYSCGDGRNNAWTLSTDAAGTNVAWGTTCPPRGGWYDGIHAFDAIGDGRQNTPYGRHAHWTFAAPPGTHISGLNYQRNVGKEGTDSWSVFTKTGNGTVLDTCSLGMASSCRLSGPTAFSGLETEALTVGFSCQVSIGTVCSNGATRHHVWAAIHQSTVTLEDPSAPTLAPSGPLWSSGPHRGTVPMTLNAADNSGVLETRMFVDGRFQEQVVQPCDATYPVPCPPAAAVTHALDTTRFANGSRRLEVLAYDSAGNATREERSVTFDNPVTRPVTGPAPAAPARPEAPAPSRSTGRRTARIRVTRAVRRGGRLLIAASLHRGARSPVTVTARTRGGTRRVRVRPERGRLSTALVLQGRGPAVLTLAYPGDRTFGSQRVSRRV